MGNVTYGRITGLVLAGACAAAVVGGPARERVAIAASPAPAQADRKPTIRGAADAQRAWLGAEYYGLTLHKIANRRDGSLAIELQFGRDALAIGIDAAGDVTVARGGSSIRVASADAYQRLQQVLAGSDAVLAARLLLAEREVVSDLQVPEMSLLSTAAFVASLAGDVDAPRRLAARFVEKHSSWYRPVRLRTCFDEYGKESSAAWDDMQNCVDEANQDPSVFNRAYRRVACNAVWLVRSESAWIEYIGCLGLGQLYQ
jgi:hypothetical protein